jgi:pimeloyl-ACP methyl ester carboxylesterase
MLKHTQFVRSGDVRIAVHSWGNTDRPTLVLVHGWPDNSSVWNGVVGELGDEFHVVAYDVRGAGESDRPKGKNAYRLENLAADFRAVIDAVNPDEPVHLAAHDWGSIQSWEFVCDPALADRIRSFTSMSGPCLDHVGWMLRKQIADRKLPDRGMLGQAVKSWYIAAFHLPGMSLAWGRVAGGWEKLLEKAEGVPANLIPHQPTIAEDGRFGMNLYRANIADRLLHPRERSTKVPVQLVVLLRDKHVTTDMLDRLDFRASSLTRVSLDAGHWAPLSHPAEVARVIASFVREAL